jgi:hypothetical protein
VDRAETGGWRLSKFSPESLAQVSLYIGAVPAPAMQSLRNDSKALTANPDHRKNSKRKSPSCTKFVQPHTGESSWTEILE